MSCLDVMYRQTYGAHHYLPAAAYRAACLHRHQHQKKVSASGKMQDPVEPTAQPALGKEHKARQEEGRGGTDALGTPAKEVPPAETEYLSSRCVLFTYFQGNIGDVVDEHFSRALGQSGTLAEDRKRSRTPPGGIWKDGASLSAGFPSALWGSSYTQQSSPCLPSVHPDFPPGTAFSSGESGTWAGHALHQPGLPPPTTLPESWHYALGAQSGPGYPHVHEVYPHMHARHTHPHGHTHHVLHHTHGATLDPRFSPLLLSSVHPTCSPTPHCEGAKAELEAGNPPTHNWSGSFHGSVDIFDSALDQDKGKTSVWF
ncbi:transcription cofactor vestigial-like protein 3 [Scleropages formosus]|uniref:Vestigial like family member 3 n=1 Tax=Scleropages formosus TaxID=113540 RepID=A0A8C9SK65_SCLFO|nr:transcription cofactor vestigial-like protein 3 [Scleropages formosus]